MNAEPRAFLNAILAGDLDACGAFADYLDERDDPRGRLLRLRWKRWRTDRERARLEDERDERHRLDVFFKAVAKVREVVPADRVKAEATIVITHRRERVDALLADYVRERFADDLRGPEEP